MNVLEEGQKQLFFNLRGQILLAHGPGSDHSCSGRWKTWDTQWPQVTSLMMRPSASARCFFHLPVSVSVLGRHGGAGTCMFSLHVWGFSGHTKNTLTFLTYLIEWRARLTYGHELCFSLGSPSGAGGSEWGEGLTAEAGAPWPGPKYVVGRRTWQRWTNNSMYFTAHLRPLLVKVWVNR